MAKNLVLIELVGGLIEYKGLYTGQSSSFKILSVNDIEIFLEQIKVNNEYILNNTKPTQYKPQPKTMSVEWNFSKLPKDKHQSVIKAYNDRNVEFLFKIHNTYKLSNYKYCCNISEPMLMWFGDAIEKQIIKS